MKPICKNIFILVIFNALLLPVAFIVVPFLKADIHFYDVSIVSCVFSVISLITISIFSKGQTKEPDSQTLHSLVALSLKFILELIFIVLWFIVAKKSSLTHIIIFFVLYLALTLFTIYVIVKTLKNKAL
ncbi:MAG TPA: hypothetical protein VFE71_09250 [Bacteroidales bacterium]|nr:hypothetical protein [Bacteroidales bacterium]